MNINGSYVSLSMFHYKGYYILDTRSINYMPVFDCSYRATFDYYSYILKFHGRSFIPSKRTYKREFILVVTGLLL